MATRSRECQALRTATDVAAVLARLRDDHALRELHAAVERDRRRLLHRMGAGGYARLARPGRIREPQP